LSSHNRYQSNAARLNAYEMLGPSARHVHSKAVLQSLSALYTFLW